MAMGKRREKQESLWIATEEIARSQGHPFYRKVNEVGSAAGTFMPEVLQVRVRTTQHGSGRVFPVAADRIL
jgi:hypothetical protein